MAKLKNRWILRVSLKDGELQHIIENDTMIGYKLNKITRYGNLCYIFYTNDKRLINDTIIFELKQRIRTDIVSNIKKTEEKIKNNKDVLQFYLDRLKETEVLMRSNKLKKILDDVF